jgi:hypothetical protein
LPLNDTVVPGEETESEDAPAAKVDEAKYQGALARLKRVYSFLNMTNEAIARIKQPTPLFDEACRIAVEVGGFRMAWIGLVDPESGQIKPVSSRGFEEGYLDRVFISVDRHDRKGRGPTGIAARTGEVNICRDFAMDPRMAPWRQEALKRGYRSSGAFPLRIGERISPCTLQRSISSLMKWWNCSRPWRTTSQSLSTPWRKTSCAGVQKKSWRCAQSCWIQPPTPS